MDIHASHFRADFAEKTALWMGIFCPFAACLIKSRFFDVAGIQPIRHRYFRILYCHPQNNALSQKQYHGKIVRIFGWRFQMP